MSPSASLPTCRCLVGKGLAGTHAALTRIGDRRRYLGACRIFPAPARIRHGIAPPRPSRGQSHDMAWLVVYVAYAASVATTPTWSNAVAAISPIRQRASRPGLCQTLARTPKYPAHHDLCPAAHWPARGCGAPTVCGSSGGGRPPRVGLSGARFIRRQTDEAHGHDDSPGSWAFPRGPLGRRA